jgi:hypothetical protein
MFSYILINCKFQFDSCKLSFCFAEKKCQQDRKFRTAEILRKLHASHLVLNLRMCYCTVQDLGYIYCY